MDPSPEDLSAGQKAYQGLKDYQRFKVSQQSKFSAFLNVLLGMALLMQILVDCSAGKYEMATWGLLVVAAIVWGLRSMEKNKRKSFEVLRQLREKYGPEIYEVLKKEPETVQYKLFHKSYPRERRDTVIELP